MPQVNALLNPITRKTVTCQIPAGKTLRETIPDIPSDAIVEINGQPDEDRPLKEDDVVLIAVVPKGAGGKDDLVRNAAMIAAITVASSVFPINPETMSAGRQFANALGRAAVASSVQLGMNALIRPPDPSGGISQQGEQFRRLGSLTGSGNRILPYGTVPRVYGKRKIYPPMSARPFTEVFSNDQYLNLLFCLGAGPLRLSNPKIGNTTIGSFDENNEFTSNDNFEDIRIDVAEAPNLYSSTVTEGSAGVTFNEEGQTAIRTSEPDADRVSLEILFRQGLFSITEQASTASAFVDFQIEIRQAGETEWQPAATDQFPIFVFGSLLDRFTHMGDGVFRANNSARETLRVGLQLEVETGQYDIRVTRLTDEGEGVDESRPQVFDSAEWTIIRSITDEKPTNMPGVVQLAMRIKATDQISGPLDNFSVVAESYLAVYDGEEWNEPVFNPLTGAAAPLGVINNLNWRSQ